MKLEDLYLKETIEYWNSEFENYEKELNCFSNQ